MLSSIKFHKMLQIRPKFLRAPCKNELLKLKFESAQFTPTRSLWWIKGRLIKSSQPLTGAIKWPPFVPQLIILQGWTTDYCGYIWRAKSFKWLFYCSSPHFRYGRCQARCWNDSRPLFPCYPDDTKGLLALPLIEMPGKNVNICVIRELQRLGRQESLSVVCLCLCEEKKRFDCARISGLSSSTEPQKSFHMGKISICYALKTDTEGAFCSVPFFLPLPVCCQRQEGEQQEERMTFPSAPLWCPLQGRSLRTTGQEPESSAPHSRAGAEATCLLAVKPLVSQVQRSKQNESQCLSLSFFHFLLSELHKNDMNGYASTQSCRTFFFLFSEPNFLRSSLFKVHQC